MPDVILMDAQMPERSCIDATREITRLPVIMRVLMLTTLSTDRHVIPALCAGAWGGHLVKDTEPRDIIHAIHDVYEGRQVISPIIPKEPVAKGRFHARSRG